jgi:hypothetical protein
MRAFTPAERGFAGIGVVNADKVAPARTPPDQRKPVGRRHPALHRAALSGRQDAKRIFAGQSIVVVALLATMLLIGHSRHSLSFIRLRRSQVRMVLSGTAFCRSASS